MSITKLIKCASINLIHKIISTKIPNSIYSLYKINRRSNVEIVTHYRPKTKKTEEFFIYKAIKQYNKIPKQIKSAKNFKKEIKNYIKN